MNKKFIIYSSQRSGSTYLSKALDSHPQILCGGALFRKTKSDRFKYPELAFNYADRRKKRGFKWFKNILIRKHLGFIFGSDRADAVGFRLLVNHVEDLPGVLRNCDRMEVSPIILIRKNIVRQAISLTLAQNAGLWMKGEQKIKDSHKIQLDLQRLGKNINYFQRCRSTLENSIFNVEPLVIYFEDLAGPDGDKVIKQVYQHLGVIADFAPKIKPMKTSKYSLKERIINYKETISLIDSKGLSSLITTE